MHKYIRSLEGTFNPGAALTGNWTSSSGQFALVNTPGSSLDPPAVAQGLATYAGAAAFNIGWTNGYGELVALYDSYKITNVKITLLPNLQANGWGPDPLGGGGNSGVSPPVPQIRWYFDRDDATVPTAVTLEEFNQRPGVRRFIMGHAKKYVFNVRPKPNTALDNGAGAATLVGLNRSQWINFSNTSVPHYGLKFVLMDLPQLNTYNNSTYQKPFIRWRVDYTILCKDPR